MRIVNGAPANAVDFDRWEGLCDRKGAPLITFWMEEGSEGFVPTKNHEEDTGWDIFSSEDIVIPANTTKLIHTGLHVIVADSIVCCRHRDIEGVIHITQYGDCPHHLDIQVRSRSGLALKQDFVVRNSPGTIDVGYTGEVCVIGHHGGTEPFEIKRGDRVGQLVIGVVPYIQVYDVFPIASHPEVWDKIKSASARGEKGFGSSGGFGGNDKQ
jgi:dUTP pyrophosphatase